MIIEEKNILKQKGSKNGNKNLFHLLGYNENSLSKAFAYLLSNNRNFYYSFLRKLGISVRNSLSNYKSVKIQIQRKRKEGIIDLEISGDINQLEKYFILIECKINKNKVKNQKEQYLPVFNNKNIKNYLVFLTQDLEVFKLPKEIKNKVKIYKLTWLDVLEEIYDPKYKKNKTISEFKKYFEEGYNMNRLIKEILVQDLGHPKEINRFMNYNVYKRPESAGKPLYFAPYFTRKANFEYEGKSVEGIKFISKILGVLTIPKERNIDFETDLENFVKEMKFSKEYSNNLIKKWKKGVNLVNDEDKFEEITFYFLEDPLILPGISKKKKTSESKGWIGGLIPKNRTVTFKSVIENMELDN